MQNSTAFKAACLSVGLATAWSPLGMQEAKADSVLQVNLQYGTSPQSVVDHAYLGVLRDNGEVATFALQSQDPQYIPIPWEAGEIAGYVALGTANADNGGPYVWVSFSDTVLTDERTFETYFDSLLDYGQTQAWVAEQLNALSLSNEMLGFIDGALNMQYVPHAVGDDIAPLVAFSDGVEGFPANNVQVSLQSAVVPLPNAVMMGGSLLVLLSFGQRLLARRRDIA